MELHLTLVFLLGFAAITTQDIRGRKECDCSICKGADNKLNPILGKRFGDDGKSGCSICEHKKELLRQEREQQEKLQKCPFQILGSPGLKGKTSEEIFDEFRELVAPSQNGFFDMMRGVVRTMHVESVAELQRAKVKEARELALKKAEEAKKQREAKKEDILKLAKPEPDPNPKVTVVVKQAPCAQALPQTDLLQGTDITLFKRLPKEARRDTFTAPEEEMIELQMLDPHDPDTIDYLGLDSSENLLDSDLAHQIDYEEWTTTNPEVEETTDTTVELDYEYTEEPTYFGTSTEFPLVKFMSHEELRAQSGGGRPWGDHFDIGFDMLPTGGLNGVEGNHLGDLLDPITHE